MPTLAELKTSAERAYDAVRTLKLSYDNHIWTAEHQEQAANIAQRLELLRRYYGDESEEINTLIAGIAELAVHEAREGDVPNFGEVLTAIDELETRIGKPPSGSVVGSGGGNKLSGGFRYSPKKRNRTPSQKFSPKKTKARRTSSKRKSASLRGGRRRTSCRTSRGTSRRTSHKTSCRTSHRTSRKKSHKRHRSTHRRRKH